VAPFPSFVVNATPAQGVIACKAVFQFTITVLTTAEVVMPWKELGKPLQLTLISAPLAQGSWLTRRGPGDTSQSEVVAPKL